MELITKESLRVFGFGHTEIDSKELVKFIADLLTDVKNFRNAREAGKREIGSDSRPNFKNVNYFFLPRWAYDWWFQTLDGRR